MAVMKIETKFNPGDSVVFLKDGGVWRKTIGHIEITVAKPFGAPEGTPAQPLIVYHFDDKDSHREAVYKYETEVAATKAELIEISKELS